ncbi:MAG: ABC transporter ATP-binding protein [Rhodospirillales bacterium]|nr:ABC transporter ATP-binding protein [Rhodospirillales bacterium]
MLQVSNLSITFPSRDRDAGVDVVDKISFDLKKGQTLGLVGESGCGKTMTALALLNLVPPPGQITGGQINLNGMNLLELTSREMRDIRGNRISMIFQEPASALNPAFTVGDQIAEAYRLHNRVSKNDARRKAVDMLARVGIPDPTTRAKAYPHQLSGGMRQRCVIAMALICEPDLLIADEPTTALDTTIQGQILQLIVDLQGQFGMGVLFISHNLAVISEIADDIIVMYAGRIAEQARRDVLFTSPVHPYTRGLINTLPTSGSRGKPLQTLPGTISDSDLQAQGCRFLGRCDLGDDSCAGSSPPLLNVGGQHYSSCPKTVGGSR